MRFVRLVVLGFVVLSVIYVLVSIYSRSVRREKLENQWDEEAQDGASPEARDQFIADGMARYDAGLRKRLILLIYVIPPILVGVIIWAIN